MGLRFSSTHKILAKVRHLQEWKQSKFARIRTVVTRCSASNIIDFLITTHIILVFHIIIKTYLLNKGWTHFNNLLSYIFKYLYQVIWTFTSTLTHEPINVMLKRKHKQYKKTQRTIDGKNNEEQKINEQPRVPCR